ncbi:MAG: hypothetical protein M1582_00690 [Actinobacteria bacterium]|nr:hypothetical protein [Actinomycetota bacterium]
MTHSLHRTGSVQELNGDFVFIIRTAKGINREGSEAKMRRMAEILSAVGPSNMGSTDIGNTMASGLTPEQYVEKAWGAKGVYCVFNTREKAKEALRRIKEAELGLCVTVSGLIDEVFAIGGVLDLPPHTINLSLGVMGKTELLPEQEILDMSTMCGHATVTQNLIRKVLGDVRSGRATVEQAACTLGEPCVCGIFNLDRARKAISN